MDPTKYQVASASCREKSKSGARLLSRGPSREVLLGMDRRLGESFVISLKTIARSILRRIAGRGKKGGSPESKTRVIATLIARINHNRGGKWRGELLKQGYVLGVTLLRLPRPDPPPSSPLFAFLGPCQYSQPLSSASFSLSIPLTSRLSPLFQL